MQLSEVNRNPLTKVRFKFICAKIPQTTYFCQSISIPGITLGETEQDTPLVKIPTPGDKLIYEDLTFRFVVNEDLDNWQEMKNWLVDIGYDSVLSSSNETYANLFAEGTILILSDKMNVIGQLTFEDMFPISLGALEFDITDPDDTVVTSEVTFKYTKYQYTRTI